MEENKFKFDSIESALEDFKAGKPIIVADDEDRENEGDVIVSAEKLPRKLSIFGNRGKRINLSCDF